MTQSPTLTYVGHATVLIEMDGQRILTDPILRNWVSLLRRRGQPIDLGLFQNLDAVLISHLHYDHLDLPSLHLLGRQRRLIVPRGSGRFFQRHGFRFVEELRVSETTSVGPLTL